MSADFPEFEIAWYHVQLATKRVTIEFRRLNPETKAYEPLVGHLRHELTLSDEVLEHVNIDLEPFLARDLAEIPLVQGHAVTSALHKLRETRAEQGEAQRAAAQARKDAADARDANDAIIETRRGLEQDVRRLHAEAKRLEAHVAGLKDKAPKPEPPEG